MEKRETSRPRPTRTGQVKLAVSGYAGPGYVARQRGSAAIYHLASCRHTAILGAGRRHGLLRGGIDKARRRTGCSRGRGEGATLVLVREC